MKSTASFWLSLSILSLFLVAFLGALMRYKIAFYLPWVEQKNLQHAHSHFAFAGWVSQTLMVLLVLRLEKCGLTKAFYEYRLLLASNLISAFGMLLAFWYQSYGPISLTFSTLSIFISYLFAWVHFQHLNQFAPREEGTPWIKFALVFLVLSSLGTFYLAFMTAGHSLEQHLYLGSVYFYLHFQYNGWFLFAILGLLFSFLKEQNNGFQIPKTWFWAFSGSVVFTYGLSVLWAQLPGWIYGLTVAATLVQTLVWFLILGKIIPLFRSWKMAEAGFWKWIFALIALCYSVKILLQLGSVFPEVSRLAFGFRPVVIAYLHLVLLASVSAFLLAFVQASGLLPFTRLKAWKLFFFALFLNQLVLGIHALASFTYFLVPGINAILFGISLLMVFGLGIAVWKVFGLGTKDTLIFETRQED
jgi:hypothetical protein